MGGSQSISSLVPSLTSKSGVVMFPPGCEGHDRSGLKELGITHLEGSVGGIIDQVAMLVVPIYLEKERYRSKLNYG